MPPTERIENSWGSGGLKDEKFLKNVWSLISISERGVGYYKKSLPLGRYGYFMELHNSPTVTSS